MSTLAWIGIVAAVFTAAMLYDFSWARYMRAVGLGLPIAAAIWSVAVYVIGLIGLVSVLKVSGWLVIPEVFGMAIGTLIGVKVTKNVD